MLIGGLWHGAGWTFIVWGGLHGVYLIANHLFQRIYPVREKQAAWSAWSGRFLTLLAVMIAWVFSARMIFRALRACCKGMFGMVTGEPVLSGTRTIFWVGILLVIVWFLPNSWQVFHRFNPVLVDRSAAASVTDYKARARLRDRIKSDYGSAGPRDGNRQHSCFNRSRFRHPALHLHDILTP